MTVDLAISFTWFAFFATSAALSPRNALKADKPPRTNQVPGPPAKVSPNKAASPGFSLAQFQTSLPAVQEALFHLLLQLLLLRYRRCYTR